jgi:hypothetical protein
MYRSLFSSTALMYRSPFKAMRKSMRNGRPSTELRSARRTAAAAVSWELARKGSPRPPECSPGTVSAKGRAPAASAEVGHDLGVLTQGSSLYEAGGSSLYLKTIHLYLAVFGRVASVLGPQYLAVVFN